MSKCEECIHEFEDANKPPCFACKENPNTKSLDNFKPKQPEILTVRGLVDRHNEYCERCGIDPQTPTFVSGVRHGMEHGKLDFYYQGGYKELVEEVGAFIKDMNSDCEDKTILSIHRVRLSGRIKNIQKPE